jgi:hypothetical protein
MGGARRWILVYQMRLRIDKILTDALIFTAACMGYTLVRICSSIYTLAWSILVSAGLRFKPRLLMCKHRTLAHEYETDVTRLH